MHRLAAAPGTAQRPGPKWGGRGAGSRGHLGLRKGAHTDSGRLGGVSKDTDQEEHGLGPGGARGAQGVGQPAYLMYSSR